MASATPPDTPPEPPPAAPPAHADAAGTRTPAGADAAPAAAAPGRRRTGRWLATVLATALLAGGGAAWWLVDQPASLAALLNRVPGLTVQGVSGGLRQPVMAIERLRWQSPAGAVLQAEALRLAGWSLQWRPHPGAWIGLRAEQLTLEAVQWTSGTPATTPPSPPTDLRLPLALAVDALRIDRLQVDQAPPLTSLQARLALGDARGAQHALTRLRLSTDVGSAAQPAPLAVQGEARIASTAPLAVQASLQVQGRWHLPGAAGTGGETPPTWQARLSADGPLAALTLRAELDGPPARAAPPPRVDAQALLRPFEAWPLGTLRLQTQALDLQALVPAWPRTALHGQAELDTRGRQRPVQARITLDNRLPGRWDSGRLPLRQLTLAAQGRLDAPQAVGLDAFVIQLGDERGPAGELRGRGRHDGDRLSLDLRLSGLQLARLHQAAAALRLDGPLQLTWSAGQPARPPRLSIEGRLDGVPLDSPGPPVQLDLAAGWQPGELQLLRASATAGAASARLSGQLQWDARRWHLASQGSLADFDPRPWWRGAPGSAWQRGPHRLQGDWRINLQGAWPARAASASTGTETADGGRFRLPAWLASLRGEAQAHLRDSRLAGVALNGRLHWRDSGPGAGLQAELDLGGNRLRAEAAGGAGGLARQPWTVALQAPQLATLAPLGTLLADWAPSTATAWPSAGALVLDGQWRPAERGAWLTQGRLGVRQLRSPTAQLEQADLRWQLGSRPDDPLDIDLAATGLRQDERQLSAVSARVRGSAADHRLTLQADSPLRPPAWTENLLGPAGTGTRLSWQGQGGWQAAAGGQPAAYRLQAGQLALGARETGGGSRAWLAAQDLAARLEAAPEGGWRAFQLAPGRLALAGTTALRWQRLHWQAGGPRQADQLDIDAELERFDVAPLLARLQPAMGWGGDLSLGGRIQLRSAETLQADIVLERQGGDLHLSDELGGVQALGLTELRLALGARDGLWQFAQGLAGRSIGTLAGAQLVRTAPGQRWPQPGDPLQGVLQARVANLGAWGTWVPPGWRLSGTLDTQGLIGGRLGAPELSGSMEGRQLGVRNMLQGVDLSDGELSVVLAGDSTRIERLRFRGGEGELRVTGGASLGAEPVLRLQLEAERFQLLARVDRQLMVSGRSRLQLARDALQVEGRLGIDQGLFDLSRGDAPTLDSDVVVHRQAGRETAAAATPASAPTRPGALRRAEVALDIDLGERLRLRGRGVDTGLRGQLRLAMPGGQPQLTGTVRTQAGRYAAYGQKLEIQRGEFLFNGPVDNPRLDILALRPNLDVEVGVAITGAAATPRVRLHSVPDMTDYEKLSWLMLGRSPDGLGNADTALLQRAALAMLGGDQGAPGDQLLEAIGLTDFSVRQAGEEGSRETIVSLGRQLSRRWYVGYERGVNTTLGTWQLVYRIAQRFTLRAQSGSDNAVDLIWTWRW